MALSTVMLVPIAIVFSYSTLISIVHLFFCCSPTAIALGFQSLKGGCALAFGPKRPQCQRGIPIGIPIAIPMGTPMASYSFLLLGGILEPI